MYSVSLSIDSRSDTHVLQRIKEIKFYKKKNQQRVTSLTRVTALFLCPTPLFFFSVQQLRHVENNFNFIKGKVDAMFEE